MQIDVHPATEDRWLDLESVFRAKGCSVARGCWCMYYRHSGKQPPLRRGETRDEHNRKALQALVSAGPPPGLIGYGDGAPIGWVALGPREVYARLERSPVMKAVDDRAVWSIICFVVPSEHRRKGVAKALLRAAISYARAQGARVLEAYPVDRVADPSAESLWFGTKAMYDEVGFTEVARRKRARPILRLELS